eukprot:GHVU01130503.1.p1 GENE.GHVU01130503.1~~GHVU01130503.1.p1  ORF type:complete len:440 (+),score=52.16 GHVU01130503.1:89-1408(+)
MPSKWLKIFRRSKAADQELTSVQVKGREATRSGWIRGGTGEFHVLFPDEEAVKEIRVRLHILSHASRCQEREGTEYCRVPQCKSLKKLLNHVIACNVQQNCPVPQCDSTKQILLHYKKCKNRRCPVCCEIKGTQEEPNETLISQSTQTDPIYIAPSKITGPESSEQQTSDVIKDRLDNPEMVTLMQQRLLLVWHAEKCPPDKHCKLPMCASMKQLVTHMKTCDKTSTCREAHCATTQLIVKHADSCFNKDCPVCLPLKVALRKLYWPPKDQEVQTESVLFNKPQSTCDLVSPAVSPTASTITDVTEISSITTAESSSSTSTVSVESKATLDLDLVENRRLRRRLVLLAQAYHYMTSQKSSAQPCKVQYCGMAKCILMRKTCCTPAVQCSVMHCVDTYLLMKHLKHCALVTCPVCKQVKRKADMIHVTDVSASSINKDKN